LKINDGIFSIKVNDILSINNENIFKDENRKDDEEKTI
jgi:hypothetical protein